MNFEQYQRGEDTYRFLRTTCGLIGFIIFFLGAFFSFIIAEETENYYEAIIIIGVLLLCATAVFFCFVMNESKRVFKLVKVSEPVELMPLVAQQGKKLRQEPQLLEENMDNRRWPTDDSDETVDSKNNDIPDIQALEKRKKYGLPAEAKESTSETSKSSQDKGSTSSGDKSNDVELDPAKAGPSKVFTDRSSEIIESRPDISPLKGLFRPSQ